MSRQGLIKEERATQDINLCIALSGSHTEALEVLISEALMEEISQLTKVTVINLNNDEPLPPNGEYGLLISVCHHSSEQHYLTKELQNSSFTTLKLEWDVNTTEQELARTIKNMVRGFCLKGLVGVDLADLRTLTKLEGRITSHNIEFDISDIRGSLLDPLCECQILQKNIKGAVIVISASEAISFSQFQEFGDILMEAFPNTVNFCFEVPFLNDKQIHHANIEILVFSD